MKKLLLFYASLLIWINCGAQSLQDSALYNKGLQMIESSKSVDEFARAGQYFDSLTLARPGDWLAPLYAGLSYVLAGFTDSGGKQTDVLCDKAQLYLDTAGGRHADASELASLQAFLYQARINVSPMERGLEYSTRADAEIKKAEVDNEDDPRPYFLYAMNVYYTPRIFGGGAEKALPLFEQAAEKFEAYQPSMPFMPQWGKKQNQDMLQKCREETE